MHRRLEWGVYAVSISTLIIAVFLYIQGFHPAVPLLGVIFSVIVFLSTRRRLKKESNAHRKAAEYLVEENVRLSEDVESRKEREIQLNSEKEEKANRLSNLKRALSLRGVDTEYLVKKYGRKELSGALITITHTKRNTHFDILNRLRDLGAITIHGATKFIPPSSIDRELESQDDLSDWFHEIVLEGRDNLTYKLELLATIRLDSIFGKDTTEGDTYYSTIMESFDFSDILTLDELLEMLSSSDRISLEKELRENIALLAIDAASEDQFEDILNSQLELQEKLGDITQITNTNVNTIERTLEERGIENARQVAEQVKERAAHLVEILG